MNLEGTDEPKPLWLVSPRLGRAYCERRWDYFGCGCVADVCGGFSEAQAAAGTRTRRPARRTGSLGRNSTGVRLDFVRRERRPDVSMYG
jgi:hypothetical protein